MMRFRFHSALKIQWRNLGNGDSVLKNGAENIHVALESSSKKSLDQKYATPFFR